jgi:hypothetical protein
MNPITGEKIITINGERLAIAEIEARYGDVPDLFKPETVADVAAAGLREKHPEYTAERIMELSPPLVPLARDVQLALRWAYFGAEEIPDGSSEVKKNRSTGGWWRRLWKR